MVASVSAQCRSEPSALIADLNALYCRTGREVTHTRPSGGESPKWANRYLQGLKCGDAGGDDAVIAFMERMVRRKGSADEGLHPLKAANRSDLTVEAIVVATGAPHHGVFGVQTVEMAHERLAAL